MHGMMLAGGVGPQIDFSPWWSVWASASRRSTSHKTGAAMVMPYSIREDGLR
jgi:hypothetical protein